MYRLVTTEGRELGITEEVKYIRRSDNGSLVPAEESEATGVAFDSAAYNLFGHSELEGADTVIVKKADGGAAVSASEGVLNILLGVRE